MGVSIVSFTRAWIPECAFIEVVSGETPARHNSSLDMGSSHQSSPLNIFLLVVLSCEVECERVSAVR